MESAFILSVSPVFAWMRMLIMEKLSEINVMFHTGCSMIWRMMIFLFMVSAECLVFFACSASWIALSASIVISLMGRGWMIPCFLKESSSVEFMTGVPEKMTILSSFSE